MDVSPEIEASPRAINTVTDVTVPNGDHWFSPEFENLNGGCGCPYGWCNNYISVNFFDEGIEASINILDGKQARIIFKEDNTFNWEAFEKQVLTTFGKNDFEKKMNLRLPII